MSYERLTADNAALLFIDHQTGLANGVDLEQVGRGCPKSHTWCKPGIIPTTWVGVGAEFLVDWRSPAGQAHGKLMGDFLTFSENNAAGFFAAKGAD